MNLMKMSLADLKAEAKEKGLKGITGLKKADLLEKMREFAKLNSISAWSFEDESEKAVEGIEKKDSNPVNDEKNVKKEESDSPAEAAAKRTNLGDVNTPNPIQTKRSEAISPQPRQRVGIRYEAGPSVRNTSGTRQVTPRNGLRQDSGSRYDQNRGQDSTGRSRTVYDNTGRNNQAYSRQPYAQENSRVEYIRRNPDGTRQTMDYSRRSYDGGRNNSDYSRQNSDYSRQNSDYGRQSSDYNRQNNDYRQNSDYSRSNNDYGRQNSDYGRQNSDYGRQTGDYGRQNTDYGRQNGDYGRQNSDYGRQSSDYNRQNNDYRQNSDYSRSNSDYSRQGADYGRQSSDYTRQNQDYSRLNSDYDRQPSDEIRVPYESISPNVTYSVRNSNDSIPENTNEWNSNQDIEIQGTETDFQEGFTEGTDAQDDSQKQSERPSFDSGVYREGVLELVKTEGYGFIRCDNYLPGSEDVYVSPAQIRRFNLKTGDYVKGTLKIKNPAEKYQGIAIIEEINGEAPEVAMKRPKFENLTPVFPHERIHFETQFCSSAMRLVDLLSPVGKGQRGMIVSQPKAGKTTLLKQMANAITQNHPEMKIIILLIDERPEEVTDIKESIVGDQVEVIYSTFDELPDNHKRVSEMVIERAKRLVEHGHDVCILLDSITRLARAYNLTVTNSGRTLSGGLDPSALYMPKKFFGAARCMREGGSLTILATALVDTGSRMDDVVFEEFKGTGNMELVLDRSLSEKRIFPAIDIQKSGTRREDLLLSRDECDAVNIMRTALNSAKSREALEVILNYFKTTRNNEELIKNIKTSGIFGKYQ
jgi:transcription termination factor Rho